MNSGGIKKTRSQRVAGLDPVPKLSAQLWRTVTRGDVVLRVALCLIAAILMVVATSAWAPPFVYRVGYTPPRDIIASVNFKIIDNQVVERAKNDARSRARQAYTNDPQLIKGLRAELMTVIAALTDAETFDKDTREIWATFLPPPIPDESATDEEKQARERQWQKQFEAFRIAMDSERRLRFEAAVEKAFVDIEKRGLFDRLEKERGGDQTEILVFGAQEKQVPDLVEVKDSLIANAKFILKVNLDRELSKLEAEAKDSARSKTKQTYVHNPESLVELRKTLAEKIASLRSAAEFDDDASKIWQEFLPDATETSPLPDAASQKKLFDQFRQELDDDSTGAVESSLAEALGEYERRGLLIELKSADEVAEGNQEEIVIVDSADADSGATVAVSDVLLPDVKNGIRERLETQFKSLEVAGRVFSWLEKQLPTAVTLQYRPASSDTDATLVAPALAERAHNWLEKRLPTTLTYDVVRAKEIKDKAAEEIIPEERATQYHAGDGNFALAKGDVPLDGDTIVLLREEYKTRLQQLTATEILNRLLAVFGMYFALYTLCGLFIYFRYPEILSDLRKFSGLLVLALLTVVIAYLAGGWKAELIPMLLFGMTVAIAYNQEVALLMTAVVGLIVVLSLGFGLAPFVILMAATATAVLMLRRVRSRVKLVYVGVCSGTVAMLTAVGVNIVDSQPLGMALLSDAGLYFLWGVAAGFAMTGLLPFIENLFGVLTEISLLELGDIAHPLLQELVRRAPGTYNHSINVASMAEAAAENIGAQGLLLRVGAYFHDIGKMLKPQYFIENQGDGTNRHETLVPAMSTLIIIAHVKDGADLARQHHLPRPIVDFIQQHHGTTLVEYFYQRASENSQSDPDAAEVDENTFRYPGPKPQTKEAGILMLADAVESASRVLVEPTPSRIESLVDEIAMKRLLDGQLDECGLTLQEVRTVQDSLVKSLTAVYHGRVKYPDQKTA